MTATRWETAQEYERSYWQGVADRVAGRATEELAWYRGNAATYRDLIVPYLPRPIAKLGKVVEVGSGPVGIATFFEGGQRFAIDPLNDFYGSNPSLSALRDPSVTYLASGGETLPFPERDVDLVIIENVLDHTQNPDQVLNEIHRVLADDGVMFFKVNIRTPMGTRIHRVLSRTKIDKGHPYSYSHASIIRVLESHGFKIHTEFADDYQKARQADLASTRTKDRLKGWMGISEFWFTAVCTKAGSKHTA